MTEFREQDLAGARFERVSLRGATFRQVYLTDSSMREVDLTRARVRGALLNGSRMRGVELVDVEISGEAEKGESGTTIHFLPDAEIFEEVDFSISSVARFDSSGRIAANSFSRISTPVLMRSTWPQAELESSALFSAFQSSGSSS